MNRIKQAIRNSADQNKKKKDNNGVVITVYEESGSSRLSQRPVSESNPNKKAKGNPKSKGSHGYDRRAQLLAYTHKLRAADNEEELISQWNDMNNSRYKSKKWKCRPTTPTKLGISFLGFFRRTKRPCNSYQRMQPSDHHHHQHQAEAEAEEDSNNNNKHNMRRSYSTGKKKKRGRRKLWRKLKGMFKGLSFVWRRKKRNSGQC